MQHMVDTFDDDTVSFLYLRAPTQRCHPAMRFGGLVLPCYITALLTYPSYSLRWKVAPPRGHCTAHHGLCWHKLASQGKYNELVSTCGNTVRRYRRLDCLQLLQSTAQPVRRPEPPMQRHIERFCRPTLTPSSKATATPRSLCC